MKKRILSAILAVTLVLGLFPPMTTNAATETSGVTGDCTWRIEENDSGSRILKISGQGEMADYGSTFQAPWGVGFQKIIIEEGVTKIGNYAFSQDPYIREIQFPNSLLYIGDSAFSRCEFTTITIPDSVKYIGKNAFKECTQLRNCQMSESVETIDEAAFRYCIQLQSINLPDTLEVLGDYAFNGCQQLTAIEIPGSLISIGQRVFESCMSLSKVTINEGVKELSPYMFFGSAIREPIIPNTVSRINDYAFGDCANLANIYIPDSVTYIGRQAFSSSSINTISIGSVFTNSGLSLQYCGVKNVTLREGVTKIPAYAFYESDNLTTVNLPESLEEIGAYAFARCRGIQNLQIPNGVKTIGEYAFQYCTALTSIEIPDSVQIIQDYAFAGCSNIDEIQVGSGIKEFGQYVFDDTAYYKKSENWSGGALYIGNVLVKVDTTVSGAFTIREETTGIVSNAFESCKNITSVYVPESVTSIGSYAFSGCSGLTTFSTPKAVKSIGQNAFAGCSSLTDMTLPAELTSIPYGLFIGCSKLKSIEIPDKVTEIGIYAFSNCSALQKITIPNSVQKIDSYAFASCTALTDIMLHDELKLGQGVFNNSGYYLEESNWENDMLYVGNHLAEIEIGNTACSMEVREGTKSIADYAFANNGDIGEIYLPDSIESIGDRAFYRCQSLYSVNIPEGITEIGEEMFYGCSNLRTIILPTTIERIGNSAFYQSGLQGIVIPSKVTEIGESAFYQCGSLQSVVIPDGVTEIKDNTFYECTYLHYVKLPNNLISIGEKAFYNCGNLVPDDSIVEITLPKTLQKVGASAFSGSRMIRRLTIPKSMEEIGNYAFSGCFFSEIVIENGVKKIGIGALACEGTYSIIKIPESVSYIDPAAFSDFYSLNRIEVDPDNPYYSSRDGILYTKNQKTAIITPSTRKLLVTVNYVNSKGEKIAESSYEYYFEYNSYKITVPEIKGFYTETSCLTGNIEDTDIEINVLYYGKKAIASGDCGENIQWTLHEDGVLSLSGAGDMQNFAPGETPWGNYASDIVAIYVDSRITSIGNYSFQNFSKLTYVDLGYGVNRIGEYVFENCVLLETITLRDEIKSISEGAFYGCSSLVEAVIPNNVKVLGNKAFQNCVQLKEVSLGAAIQSVGDFAFSGCAGLQDIYFKGQPVQLGENALGSTASKRIYYYPTVSGWEEEIDNGYWKGYLAIPYSAISEGTFDGTDVYILKIVDKHGKPLQNAVVKFAGETSTTNKDGMVYYTRPKLAVKLSVECSKHATFIDENYKVSPTQMMDVIELSDSPSVVQGISCDGNSIATSVFTLNCNSEEEVSIVVSGTSDYDIMKYELLQNNRIIASVDSTENNCTFRIKANYLEEGKSVIARMYLTDGTTVSTNLNIEVLNIADISETQVLGELSEIDLFFKLEPFGTFSFPSAFKASEKEEIYTKIEGNTIQVGINLDIASLFDKDDDEKDGVTKKSILQKQIDETLKKYKKGNNKYKLDVCGYIEIEYLGNNEYYVKTCYVKAAVGAELGFKMQGSFYGIIGVYFNASWSGEGGLELKLTRYTPEEGFQWNDVDVELKNSIYAEIGVYLAWGFGSGSAYGNLDLGFTIGVFPAFNLEEVYVKGEIGVKWSVLWGLYRGEHVIVAGDIYRWPEANLFSFRTYMEQAMSEAQNNSEYYMRNDRFYLNERSPWLHSIQMNSEDLVDNSYLQTGIYYNVAPKVITCGDTTVMVWLDDNGERDANNFQTLYYSVYDNSTERWMDPIQVDSNDTFDCEFSLATDQNKIYLLYTEQKTANTVSNLDINNPESILNWAKDVEVAVTVFENGKFSKPQHLTNNDACEVLPRISFENGQMVALWNEDSSLGISEEEIGCNVHMSCLNSGIWSEPVTVIKNSSIVSDVTTVTLGNQTYVAMIADADGNRETQNDQSLLLADGNGEFRQIASGSITQVSNAKMGNRDALTWNNGGTIYALLQVNANPIPLLSNDVYVSGEYQFVPVSQEKSLLTFAMRNVTLSEAEDAGTDVYGIYVDNVGNVLSSIMRITETEGYIDHYSVMKQEEQLSIIFTETYANVVDEAVETNTSLRCLNYDMDADIVVNSVEFDINESGVNETLDMYVELGNKGLASVENVTINLRDVDGNLIDSVDCILELKAGSIVTKTIQMKFPNNIQKGEYTIEVLSDEISDANLLDNQYPIILGYSDFAVAAEQKIIGGKQYILLTVENTGNVSATANIFVRSKDAIGDVLAKIETEEMEPGIAGKYMVDVDSFADAQNNVIVCTVESNEYEPFTLDNTETVILFYVDGEAFKDDPEEVVKNPILSTSRVTYDKYTGDNIVVEITEESDKFSTISGLVKGEDFKVSGTTVTILKTYLESLTVGNHTLEFEFDYGLSEPVVRSVFVQVIDTTPIRLSGNLRFEGETLVGNTVYADLSELFTPNANIDYLWQVDNAIVSTDISYTITAQDYGKELKLTVIGKDGYTGELYCTSNIDKKRVNAPARPIVASITSSTVKLVSVEGVEYSIDGVIWKENPIFDLLLPNTNYTFYARYKETENTHASETSAALTVTTLKRTVVAPQAPIIEYKTYNSITLVYNPNYEYKMNDGEWQSSNLFVDLLPNTEYTFYQRLKETNTDYASDSSIGMPCSTDELIGISGIVAIFGTPQCGETLTVDLEKFVGDENQITYQWYCNDVAISGAITESYIVSKEDMGKVIKVVITGCNAYNGSLDDEIRIRDYIAGDVNDDGIINDDDVVLIRCFLAEWDNITINLTAADVNRDGKVNVKDASILQRFIANWDGVELK